MPPRRLAVRHRLRHRQNQPVRAARACRTSDRASLETDRKNPATVPLAMKKADSALSSTRRKSPKIIGRGQDVKNYGRKRSIFSGFPQMSATSRPRTPARSTPAGCRTWPHPLLRAKNELENGGFGRSQLWSIKKSMGLAPETGRPFFYMVPGARVELAQRQAPRDFKSITTTFNSFD